MLTKATLLILLAATFVAANPVYIGDGNEVDELRGVKEFLGQWINDVRGKVNEFLENGKDNIASILETVKHDRIQITALSKKKLAELGQKLSEISKEMKKAVGDRKDGWLSRLEQLKEEGKNVISASLKNELKNINESIKKFLESQVHTGKKELIELMEEIKKILNEEGLQELKDKLDEVAKPDFENVNSSVEDEDLKNDSVLDKSNETELEGNVEPVHNDDELENLQNKDGNEESQEKSFEKESEDLNEILEHDVNKITEVTKPDDNEIIEATVDDDIEV